jgi:hypothetical protein
VASRAVSVRLCSGTVRSDGSTVNTENWYRKEANL